MIGYAGHLSRAFQTLIAVTGWVLLTGCHGARPAASAVRDGRLAPCPSSPNCVSSQAPDAAHRVEPLPLSGPVAAALVKLADIVRSLPRTAVVESSETYLRAEFTSALFRFVDDVEFFADEAAGVIHVRSASRVGSSDLGVNRRRVEQIRSRWDESPQR